MRQVKFATSFGASEIRITVTGNVLIIIATQRLFGMIPRKYTI